MSQKFQKPRTLLQELFQLGTSTEARFTLCWVVA